MVLVDGYNAIRRVSRLAETEKRGGLEAGRAALVSAIVASGVLGAERVVVVLDGSRSALPSAPSPHRRLAVRYARAPQTADEAIVELVSSATRRDALTVVTADTELAWRVRELGASVVPPESWEGVHPPARRRPRRSAPGSEATGKPAPSARDVEHWLRIFGDDADG